jgi:hypothetical protein
MIRVHSEKLTVPVQLLVYCDDESHTANPVGPLFTDPNFVVPDDLYIAARFVRRHGYWTRVRRIGGGFRRGQHGHRELSIDGQDRELLDDGTALAPKAHQARLAQEAHELLGETREKWNPQCRWCRQRGGRWKAEDRDEVFDQLSERSVIGVSLRSVDTIKHSGIRAIKT